MAPRQPKRSSGGRGRDKPAQSTGGRRGAAAARAEAGAAGSGRGAGPKGGRGSKPPKKGQGRGPDSGDRQGPPKKRSGGGANRGGQGSKQAGGSKRGRPKGLGGDHVEGRQAVRELLLAGNRRVHEVLMIEDLDSAGILEDIAELSVEMNLSFKLMNRRRFEAEALTQSHQGVMARAQPLPEAELDDLALQKGAFLLVLDGVTDPGNLGAMLRTAECAGVTGVVMPKHRAVHITPTAAKNAAGAIEHLPMSTLR